MDEQKGTAVLDPQKDAALQRKIDRMTPLDGPTKECIRARLRGLNRKFLAQFWRQWRCKSVDDFSRMELPAINQMLFCLESQQSGKSIFDLKHEDPCGFGYE